MSASHVARAEELRSKLEPVAEVLRGFGLNAVVETDADRSLAMTLLTVTFEGTPEAERTVHDFVMGWARGQGIALQASDLNTLPDSLRAENLRPGEQRVGFVASFTRSKAA